MRNFSENQRKVFVRRRSSKPLETRAMVESIDVGSGMALIFTEIEAIGAHPLRGPQVAPLSVELENLTKEYPSLSV